MTRTEHLLTILMEECAETAQRASKALRFGLSQVQEDPDDRPEENPGRLDNRARIEHELGHLLAVARMLELSTVPDPAKPYRVEQYLRRSAACGTLQKDAPVPEPDDGLQACEGCGARAEHLTYTRDDAGLCDGCYDALTKSEAGTT